MFSQSHGGAGEPLVRKGYAIQPESIMLVGALEGMLTEQGKFDEAQKFTYRLYELQRLYRPK